MRRFRITSIVLLLITSLGLVQPVYAAELNINIDTMKNNITFYDPKSQACATAVNTSLTTGSGSVSGDLKNREETVLRYFTGKGLTLAQASGFVGNMVQESTVRSDIVQGGATAPANYVPINGVGFGLVQWTYTSRQGPLESLATTSGRKIIDMNLQLDYIWQELTTTYKSTLQTLIANPAVTPVDAAIIVHGKTDLTRSDPRFAIAPELGYEASGDTAQQVVDVRGGAAQTAYDTFKGTIPDGTGVQTGVSASITPASTPTGQCNANAASGASTTCNVTAPVQGTSKVGNAQELTQAQLTAIFGDPTQSVMEPKMVTVDFLGHSVQVHPKVAACLTAVANDIKASNIPYTVDTIGGYRLDAASGVGHIGLSSYHDYGAAVDINAATNPYNGTTHDMPQAYVDAFFRHGWTWGGDWTHNKDWMHFEFNGIGPSGGNNVSA